MHTKRSAGPLGRIALCLSLCGGIAIAANPSAAAEDRPPHAALVDVFTAPPQAAGPAAYWAWLNGYVDREQLTRELVEMRAKGIRKLYIFECGARGPEGMVPAGPAFMSDESVDDIAYAVREAGRLGMELGFTTSSSWNAGGSWVTPPYASMGLYHAEIEAVGPVAFDQELPFPKVAPQTPLGDDGRPLFYRDVAVLAVPEPQRVDACEFVFELARPGPHTVERIVLTNTPDAADATVAAEQCFVKDFAVLISPTTDEPAAYGEVLRESLQPNAQPQAFVIDPAAARYIKLRIFSTHGGRLDRAQLGEFEVFSPEGVNVAARYRPDGLGQYATLLRATAALGTRNEWTADKIHDGAAAGPAGSWASGPLPLRIADADAMVDLTGRLEPDGRLRWQVPPGRWTILRFVCANTGQRLAVPSPNSQGLAIDHFNPAATRMHFRYLIDRLAGELGPLRDTALTTLYVCSYELRGAAWTPDFLEQFRRRRGYDMTRFLPVLVGSIVGDEATTERFRYDYRKTQGDLLVDAFYKTAAEITHEEGLLLCAEAGGPGPPTHNVPVDALKAQGTLDIPRGEFWTDLHLWVVKETACAAHVYGKPIVDMEAFTSWAHWQHGPFELKPFADRAMAEGTNHFTFHTSPHVPPEAGRPGWVYHAGTHMGPSLAWWPKAQPFLEYLARCSAMLQAGQFVGDVCYYYGDQAFNFVPPKHVDPALGPGYDYDVINAEAILTRMRVADGRWTLPDGLSYELLVLPERQDMDLDVLRKLEALVRAGGTLVGPMPTRSNGLTEHPQRDRAVAELAAKIWGECDGAAVTQRRYGKGRVIWGRSLREVLHERGFGPDFSYPGQETAPVLDFIHRRGDGWDAYFVHNRTMEWQEIDCRFRVRGRQPELWDPATGKRQRCAVWRETEEGTQLPLSFPPAGSIFVVFAEPSPKEHFVELAPGRPPHPEEAVPAIPLAQLHLDAGGGAHLLATRGGTFTATTSAGRKVQIVVKNDLAARPIDGPWQVRFPEGWGAPAETVFERLHSWTESEVEGIRYFSGIAAYEKTFDLPGEWLAGDRRVLLDLGGVQVIADVTLNGQSLGIVWKPPFRLDVTAAARSGKNQLRVEIANTWSNRLVGDALSPDGPQYTRTNMTRSQTWQVPWAETPLLPSGLLGPVRLIPVAVVPLPDSR